MLGPEALTTAKTALGHIFGHIAIPRRRSIATAWIPFAAARFMRLGQLFLELTNMNLGSIQTLDETSYPIATNNVSTKIP